AANHENMVKLQSLGSVRCHQSNRVFLLGQHIYSSMSLPEESDVLEQFGHLSGLSDRLPLPRASERKQAGYRGSRLVESKTANQNFQCFTGFCSRCLDFVTSSFHFANQHCTAFHMLDHSCESRIFLGGFHCSAQPIRINTELRKSCYTEETRAVG